ncbi:MAG: ribonuclease Z [Candidatus Kariarchaeaceae archaeon]|jgi:ribonuclease Z
MMGSSKIMITFLGTGSAIPPENRQQVSFALRHGGGLVIFDCGEGTQYSIRKFRISTRKEIVICLSHLHSDHFLGLPGLLSSFQLLNREDPIDIVGPAGTSIMVNNIILANFMKLEYEIRIHELQPYEAYQGKGYKVKAINAKHEARALSYLWLEENRPGKVDIEKITKLGIPSGPLIGDLQNGKAVEWKGEIIQPSEVVGQMRRGRIIAYSGDTAPNPELVKNLTPCDLLIHEATYPDGMEELAIERGHTTVSQAAKIAKSAKVKRLILTHFSPRITNWEDEAANAKLIFQNTEFADEGLQIVIDIPNG